MQTMSQLTGIHIYASEVMIAEDDDDDFEFFYSAVAEISTSTSISRAENGKMLMERLNSSEKPPDILFLDIIMPAIDGKECLKMIRSNKRFDSLPIIIFSSLTDPQTIDYCFREGSNLFVFKPSSLSALRDDIKTVFSINWSNLYYPPASEFILHSTLPEKIDRK
jgi:PleD family two-component response regulator